MLLNIIGNTAASLGLLICVLTELGVWVYSLFYYLGSTNHSYC